MVMMHALWLPILLSTLAAFMASALVWTALHVYDADWQPLPADDAVTATLRDAGAAPGQYYFPAALQAAQKDPAAAEFVRANPGGYVFVRRPADLDMRRNIGFGLLYNLAVVLLVAYVASRALPPGAEYLAVFRIVATTTMLGFGAAHVRNAIWFSHSWTTTWKQVAEAVVYGLIVAGIFGWLWP